MPVWGIFAFDVEFNGVNSFSQVHTCNYLIFIANLISIGLVIRNHRVSITKQIDNEEEVRHVHAD